MKYLKTKHVSTELLTLYSESPEFLNQEKDDGQFTKIGNDKTEAKSLTGARGRCPVTVSVQENPAECFQPGASLLFFKKFGHTAAGRTLASQPGIKPAPPVSGAES